MSEQLTAGPAPMADPAERIALMSGVDPSPGSFLAALSREGRGEEDGAMALFRGGARRRATGALLRRSVTFRWG